MDIIQSFYDNLASQYDKLFLDWRATTREQAEILKNAFYSLFAFVSLQMSAGITVAMIKNIVKWYAAAKCFLKKYYYVKITIRRCSRCV